MYYYLVAIICDDQFIMLYYLQRNRTKMYRANRGYPTGPAGGFMGHESLEDTNQEMEGELKELMSSLELYRGFWASCLEFICLYETMISCP